MQTALHPLVYLPFHLASHHMAARCFDNKLFTYPAHLAFTILQFGVEHFSAELPSLASLNGVLVPIALSLAPYTYYKAYKKTTGPKWMIPAAVAQFFVTLFVAKGLELGFPKDDPAEQAAANLDPTHSRWHLLLHVAIIINGLMFTAYVPWNTKPAVPASPKHTTKMAGATQLAAAKDCAPASPVKHSKVKFS